MWPGVYTGVMCVLGVHWLMRVHLHACAMRYVCLIVADSLCDVCVWRVVELCGVCCAGVFAHVLWCAHVVWFN